jgi:prevent-host-death family protein
LLNWLIKEAAMRTVGAFEAKTHFSQLVDEVNRTGHPVVVQRRGRNVAILEAYGDQAAAGRDQRGRQVLEAFAAIRASQRPAGRATARQLIEEGRER